MMVSSDRTEALVGWYKTLATPNPSKQQTLKLYGVDESKVYEVTTGSNQSHYYGDELMSIGLPLPVEFNGVNGKSAERGGDYQSHVFYLKAVSDQFTF